MKRTIWDADIRGRRVLIRTDYNVPIAGALVLDDLRVRASLLTIRALREEGARIVLCSHRGRPAGRRTEDLSLAPVARHLADLLGMPVRHTSAVTGPDAASEVSQLRPGEVLLLENVRFESGETSDDAALGEALAGLGDVFVSDGFGVLHRAHASVVGPPRSLPAVVGLSVERELHRLAELSGDPGHPFVLILGGAKAAEKLPVLEHFLSRADVICLGGAAATAVLAARGYEVGASAPTRDELEAGHRLFDDLSARGDVHTVLPVDVVATYGEHEAESARVLPVDHIGPGYRIVDIGPQTAGSIAEAVQGARVVLWNGPMGIVERPPFDRATRVVAAAVSGAGGRAVVAGGDTVGAVRRAGLDDRVWHLSTGGGATLRYLAGLPLPGLDAIPDGQTSGTR